MRTAILRSTLLLALVVVACGKSSGTPKPPTPPGGDDAGQPAAARVVHGKAQLFSWDESGHGAPSPVDLGATIFDAQTPEDGGGWRSLGGAGLRDGTFSIDGLAPGGYWIEHYDVSGASRDFLWTDADELHFDLDSFGRGDSVAAQDEGSALVLNITGAEPIDPNDAFQYTCANQGLVLTPMPLSPNPGETTLSGTLPWKGYPLNSAAAHDQAVIAQVRTYVDDGGSWWATPVATASPAPFDQVDGQLTPVNAAFTPAPTVDYALNWKRSAFMALTSEIHPTRVQPDPTSIFVLAAMPGGTTHGVLTPYLPVVLTVWPEALFGTADLDVHHTIGQPYPESWLFNQFEMDFNVAVPAPDGANAPASMILAAIGYFSPQLSDDAHPATPLISPVRAPQINGQDLFQDQRGVGLTPTISWTPPEIGEPTGYFVQLLEWTLLETPAPQPTMSTLFVVPGKFNAVKLPERVLVPGKRYLLIIRAVHQDGLDVNASSFFPNGMPFGFADAVTNSFTP